MIYSPFEELVLSEAKEGEGDVAAQGSEYATDNNPDCGKHKVIL